MADRAARQSFGEEHASSETAQRWCVLRTSGPKTLPLLRSLVDAGLDAWTPIKVVEARRGRSRAREDVEAPIMPTFVFARAELVPDLVAWAESPVNPHPGFSIFRHLGRIPLIGEADIAALRTEEGRADLARQKRERDRLSKQRRQLTAGQNVTVEGSAFAGLSGVVEQDTDGKFALVCFGDWRLKVATFLLRTDGVHNVEPDLGAAA